MIKQGKTLKDGDVVLRPVDPDGRDCSDLYSWKVAKLLYTPPLGIDDLKVGQEYGVWVHQYQKVIQFKLIGVDLDAKVCQVVGQPTMSQAHIRNLIFCALLLVLQVPPPCEGDQ
jgi:hypothetical protein